MTTPPTLNVIVSPSAKRYPPDDFTVGESLNATISEDNAVRLTQADLLANANDIDGDILTASNVQVTGGNATVVNNDDGSFSVIRSPDSTGDVTLTSIPTICICKSVNSRGSSILNTFTHTIYKSTNHLL
jgi:hypothetical protein